MLSERPASHRGPWRPWRLLLALLLVQAARGDLLAGDLVDRDRDRIMSLPLTLLAGGQGGGAVDVRTTLECHPRVYNSTVTRTDRNGRSCYDHVSVTSCWGRCDSNEISDYRFPYKRSHHPVCIHDVREVRVLTLRHCQEGALPGTERYEYLEAKRCSCRVCRSSEASCEGLRYRALGALGPNGGPATGPAAQQGVIETLVINNRD